MRRWLIAVWLLVGLSTVAVLVVAATTGGARAQEAPPMYEYMLRTAIHRQGHVNNIFPEDVIRGISETDAPQGWQIAETHVTMFESSCYPGAQGNGSTVCEYYHEWNILLRRPHQ